MKDNQKLMSLNIQRFSDDNDTGNSSNPGQSQKVEQSSQGVQNQSSNIDYDKIQGMIDSRNSKTEESVLKSYFQSQGLSEDEMKEAINTFKTQKEANKKQEIIDNDTLKNDLASEKVKNLKLEIEKEAQLQGLYLVDRKTIPYLIKLADLTNCVNEKGEVDVEAIKTALQKVLEDVPSLKKENPNFGDLKIGADGSQGSENNIDSTLSRIFGTKK